MAAKVFCVLAQPPKTSGEKPGARPVKDISYGEILKGRVSPARQPADVLVNRECLPGRCSVAACGPSLKPEVTFGGGMEGAGRSSGLAWQ